MLICNQSNITLEVKQISLKDRIDHMLKYRDGIAEFTSTLLILSV